MHEPIRILVAKPGLDGHDRGAKVIATALKDAGMEVIYSGIRQTPEQIVNTAIQEDVNAIGLSILSGAHNFLLPKVVKLLNEGNAENIKVFAGGVIPDEDIAFLKENGIADVFTPGSSLAKIVNDITASLNKDG
ncbi:MAG: cobalamin B12-binding domain-containing protein [bacterium]|nr:cobalamin B12-binding domain-containing protein [bacterium]